MRWFLSSVESLLLGQNELNAGSCEVFERRDCKLIDNVELVLEAVISHLEQHRQVVDCQRTEVASRVSFVNRREPVNLCQFD